MIIIDKTEITIRIDGMKLHHISVHSLIHSKILINNIIFDNNCSYW